MVKLNMEGIRDRGNSFQAIIQCQDNTGTVVKHAKAFRKSDYTSVAEAAHQAQQWRLDAIFKIKRGLWSEEDAVGFKEGVTVGDVYKEMVKNVWNGTRTKASSSETYLNHFQTFIKYAGLGELIQNVADFKYLNAFTSALLSNQIKGVRKGVKTSTCNRILTSVFQLLEYSKKCGYLDSSKPLPDKKDLRVKEVNLEKRAITHNEGIEMLQLCRTYPNDMFRLVYSDIIEFCMHTGLRETEALTMKKKHYKKIDGVPYAVVTRERAKSGKERSVVLTARAVQIINHHCQGINNEDFVFRNKKGNPITKHQLRHCFEKLKMKMGIGPEVTFHSTRHTAITNMEREYGLSVSQIQRMVGHSSPVTTSRYISTPPDDDKIINEKLNAKQIPLRLVGGMKG